MFTLRKLNPDLSLVYTKFCGTVLAVARAVVDQRQIDQILAEFRLKLIRYFTKGCLLSGLKLIHV